MVRSWFYQLQNIDPVQVGKIKADVKVVDYSRDGSAAGAFTAKDVDIMRGGSGIWGHFGSTVPSSRVLSYISIGEAETYRHYWDPRWLKDKRPLFLGPENPDWAGNYKVEFWHGEWKQIIFNYLDDIMDAGFDGIYLDIIDAYEFYEDMGIHDAGDRMIRFVRQIADHCQKRNPFFWIVPQNGEGLLTSRAYRDTINAIAKEDLIFGVDGDGIHNGTSMIAAVRKNLDLMVQDDKPVLVVEYVNRSGDVKDAYRMIKQWNYVPLVADRALDKVA